MNLKQIGSFLTRPFTPSSYPLEAGAQNRDNFERNQITYAGPMLGGPVSREQRALTLSTVMACRRLIAGTVSTLPCFFYERNPTGRKLALDHPLYTVLHDSPNADMTSATFWQAYVGSMMFNGEAYAEKEFGAADRVVALDYLDFNRLSWTFEKGRRVYRYIDLDGTQRVIPREKLFRTLGLTLNGIDGVSAIRYGAMMFGSAGAADMAANQTFKNGLMATTFFKVDRVLKKEQRDEARTAIKKLSGAANAGEPQLLEGGMDVQALGINPSDAQLLESRAWSVEEICRWFGVPPHLVGHMVKSTSWGTGLEQQNLGFITYCLAFYLENIEQAISKDVLTVPQRQRYYAEFSVDALRRGDSAGRAALYSSAAQNGWMTRAEIREYENLPFVPGSDDLTAQSNLLPLEKLGDTAAAPASAVQDALKNFLGLIEGKDHG